MAPCPFGSTASRWIRAGAFGEAARPSGLIGRHGSLCVSDAVWRCAGSAAQLSAQRDVRSSAAILGALSPAGELPPLPPKGPCRWIPPAASSPQPPCRRRVMSPGASCLAAHATPGVGRKLWECALFVPGRPVCTCQPDHQRPASWLRLTPNAPASRDGVALHC